MKNRRLPLFRLAAAVAALACLPSVSAHAQTVINSSWIGNGGPDLNTGNWSDSTLWNPMTVPNNAGGNVYDVSITPNAVGYPFDGPNLDINVQIRNLTLVSTGFLDNQASPGTNLTVTGSTTFSNLPGEPSYFYGAIFSSGGTFTLGTLTNFNASTKTLEKGFLVALNGGTIGFRGADIVTNNGVLSLYGAGSRIINQDTGMSALTNLAVNNSTVEIRNGANFSTSGSFTNNGGVGVSSAGAESSRFSAVSLTNYDASTHTLSGGSIVVEALDPQGTANFRFGGADIRTLSDADVRLTGRGATITDLAGNNAFRNLGRIENATFTSGGVQTHTPNGTSGGTFTASNSTHVISSEAAVTVQGNYYATNQNVTRIEAPGQSANTSLTINGNALIQDGSSIDMGGQPGVNTLYTTQLQVINGLEFRGAFLTGTGTIIADTLFTQGSTLAPGASPGELAFQGRLTLESTTLINIQLGGLTAGTGFDQIVQSGPMSLTLGGFLALSVIDGFENSISGLDSFEIMRSDNLLLGNFENVASGQRLTTVDGTGSFLVTYEGNSVFLSDYQGGVPEPGTWAMLMVGALLLLAAYRRRTRSAGGS